MILDSTAVHLHARLAIAQARGRVPSIVAGVVRSGEQAWFGTRGTAVRDGEPRRAGEDTQYRIGSITKTFTAALVLLLREEGRLSLDDTVGDHVPEGLFPDATLRGLLAHGAGLPAEPVGPWWERSRGADYAALVAANAEAPRVLGAGEQYHYSNLAYAILGRVLEAHHRQRWFDALRARILDPLGMARTTYGPAGDHAQGYSVVDLSGMLTREPHQDTGAMAPAGQLWSTAADLGRWAHELSRPDPQVLTPAALRSMTTPQSADPDEHLTGAYGLGLRLAGPGPRMLVGHTGAMPGFLAALFVDRTTDVGAAVLCNAGHGADAEGLARELVELVLDREPPLEPEWTPTISVDDAVTELLGSWYWGNAPFDLVVEGGVTLQMRLRGTGRGSAFDPVGPDVWVGRSGYQTGETMRVVRRPDGSVSHLDVGTFCYTRIPYDPDVPIPGASDEDRRPPLRPAGAGQ